MAYKFLSLIFLIFSPLIPAVLIMTPIFPRSTVIVRRFAKWFGGLHFIYSLCFLLCFNPNLLSMSFKEELSIFKTSWLNSLGASATFAVDGLSLLLCILTTFIFLIALIVSKYEINSKHKIYYSLIFILETSVLGVFCAKDIFLFFTFWMIEIIPMYFLILLWENSKNQTNTQNNIEKTTQKTASKFLIINVLGGMFLLFGILILYFYSFSVSGVLTTSIDVLSFDEFLNPIWLQILIFVSFLLGFASRFPLFPLHSWYPETNNIATMPVNIILSTCVLNMGIYGFVRFNMQIFPTPFKTLSLLIMVLSVVAIAYFSMIAYVKKNIKEIISYLNMALLGFVLLGFTSVTQVGITGAILQLFGISFVITALYIIAGVIYLRTKTLDINELGGIARNMPILLYLSYPVCFCAIGTPFLILFAAEFMVITGVFTTELLDQIPFQISGIISIFALLLVFAAVFRFLHKTFYENILTKFANTKDLTTSELISLLIVLIPIVIFGLSPNALISIYDSTVSILMEILRI